MSALPTLTINPALDIAGLGNQFADSRRIRIPSILASGAPDLYRHLEATDDWVQVINRKGGVHELPTRLWRDPARKSRPRITPGMLARARDDFQYCYAALRVPAKGETCADPMVALVADWVASPQVRAMLSAITGIADPTFTDGQITAYGEGDFLTGHDDDLAGSGRKAAFVLGLTPQWRLEWGGLLLFHEIGGVDVAGMVPQFNTLDLFAVPKYHSVSMVTAAAPRRRFSITGWLSEV